MSSASPAQEFATQFLPLLLFSTMALSLTEVRSRYIVRKDATHGRDYVYDFHGDWTDDSFAVAFHEAVVWNYMALALAGPEATLQELKRDRYVPSGVLSLDEIRRVYTLKLKASDLRPYVISTTDQSNWSDDTVAVTIFEAIEASVPKKEAQEPCKHHSECMHNGMPWETNGMIGNQLTRKGTNWQTPTEQTVDLRGGQYLSSQTPGNACRPGGRHPAWHEPSCDRRIRRTGTDWFHTKEESKTP